jgi:hypothetical protein
MLHGNLLGLFAGFASAECQLLSPTWSLARSAPLLDLVVLDIASNYATISAAKGPSIANQIPN